jgi:hypothetical protein
MVRLEARRNMGSLYRFGPRECIVPYVMCGDEYLIGLILQITGGCGRWKKKLLINLMARARVFVGGTSSALYSRLERYPYTDH